MSSIKSISFLLDTNIIFDVLLDRAPYADKASEFYSLIDSREHVGYLCSTSITTIHYILQKALGSKRALKEIQTLLRTFAIASVDERILGSALGRGFPDYEDAVIHEAALAIGADAIVTRNVKDFSKSLLPVFNPMEGAIVALPKREEGTTD